MADFTIRQIMSLCNRGDVKRTQTAGMKPDRSGGSVKLKKSLSQCAVWREEHKLPRYLGKYHRNPQGNVDRHERQHGPAGPDVPRPELRALCPGVQHELAHKRGGQQQGNNRGPHPGMQAGEMLAIGTGRSPARWKQSPPGRWQSSPIPRRTCAFSARTGDFLRKAAVNTPTEMERKAAAMKAMCKIKNMSLPRMYQSLSLRDNVSSNFATGSSPSTEGTVAVTWTVALTRSPVSIACFTSARTAAPSLHVNRVSPSPA